MATKKATTKKVIKPDAAPELVEEIFEDHKSVSIDGGGAESGDVPANSVKVS